MTRFLIAAIVVVALLVFGPVWLLSRANDDAGRFEGKSVLYNAYPEKIKTLDPTLCGDTISAAMQANVYEPLYGYHYLKRPVEVIPLLAESMPEISDDGLTYTIRLRDDALYAANPCFGVDENGQPKTRAVRASDFVLSFLRAADVHLPSPMAWSFLGGRIVGLDDYHEKTKDYHAGDFSRYQLSVEGVQALNDRTLRIQLTEPFPPFLYILAMHSYSPIPPELIRYYLERRPAHVRSASGAYVPAPGGGREIPLVNRTPQITQAYMAVGTGPYVITTWERGSRIIFERNPLYRDVRYPSEGAPGDAEAGLLQDAGKRVPFIDVLYYRCITQDFSSWMQFLSGQLDVSGIPRDVFNQVITPDKELGAKWEKRGIRLVTYEDPSVYWLGFNMEDPIVGRSKSLRQAMCLAYNVEAYIEVLINGRGKRAVNTLPSSFPAHKEAGPGPYYRYDPVAAKAKLEEAKKELAAAGLLGPNGEIPTIQIDLGSQDDTARKMGEFTKQQFDAVGIPVRINLNDWPTFQQKVHNKQVQAYQMGWHADYPDPENFLQLYYGPNVDKGTNSTNYRNPEFDELYRKIITMPDSPERKEICARMVQILNEDVPVLLLVEPVAFMLPYEYVLNYKRHPVGYGMMKYLRLDTERRRELQEN
ncbi:MAG TPA: ABC transporter substrate-binding protein [Phycisphaerae bacterium]|nr:ABC transporter substrate-binding protein [Phycisphaerae bacterium]HOM52029.1 ABC transporter substrate-binding protein [Phycisphaerae bacterium]HON64925.1 ABC transporter substrate-binding protein [Phycisphaerae bacterium]HOQ86210.1 ABC transporter substrate-binding protein [Phycisphaerae bacterium]HPP27347.1 ABC transporter substrate-binding protein [Phycisphaerae bacterium]